MIKALTVTRLRDERGQTAVEYALILLFVSIVLGLALATGIAPLPGELVAKLDAGF